MKKVCIFGPIHIFGKTYLPIYKELVELCKKYFTVVVGTYPDFWDSQESAQAFYKRSHKTVVECDLFIAEVTSPSLGVGMELQIASDNKIPCIALCKKDVVPSQMVLGLPALQKTIYYENVEDLYKQVECVVQQFTQESQ